MSGVLGTVKISDVPEIKADTYTGNATIGGVTEREVNNGKIQISIPFLYERTNKAGDVSEAKFTKRVFVDPAWYEPDYKVLNPNDYERGSAEASEAYAYQLNMSKVLRPIALHAGLDTVDHNQFEGKSVGIQLGPEGGKNGDPSRQDLKRVFAAKK